MHRSSTFKGTNQSESCYKVDWNSFGAFDSVEIWLENQPVDRWKQWYDDNGFLVVENLLSEDEMCIYREVYDKMLSGEINSSAHRHDLGNQDERKTQTENITQICWPSLYVEGIYEGPLHMRSKAVADVIIGSDSAFDFDMLIYKAPNTDTETPWHQDESYWLDMPDKRAASCWVALDDSTVENGCMWFVPKSHKLPLRVHRKAKEGCHVRMCDCKNSEGFPVPLKAGSCTFHSGRTLHYAGGNRTDSKRRAYIVNYRPLTMVEYERQHKFDHGMQGIDAAINQSAKDFDTP